MKKRSPKELVDYKKIRENFLSELKKASKNKNSSIAYIRNTFPHQSILKSLSPKTKNESRMVQAFAIGGTNFEMSLAQIFKKGELKEIKKERKTGTVPIFNNAKTFLIFIKKYLHPKAQAVAINFAYVLQPTIGKFGEVDGILEIGTKEHRFTGLLGKAVGEFLRSSLKRDIPITVVNDTVCLGTNGLVIGSGFNFSLAGVNLEAGNFNHFPATAELETIDKASTNPGRHRFEKFVSGNYLPLHFNLLAQKQQLAIDHIENGKELSDLAATEFGAAGDLARSILTRSASSVACTLAAAYTFMHQKTLTFTTEGSLFWQGWEYKHNVEKQLQELGVPKGGIRFKKVTDSSMQGALKLFTRTK